MAKVINPTKVITGVKTRWSYANVWQAKSINGGTPKFSVSLIIPKSDTKTVTAVKNAIQAAYEEGQSKLKGNRTNPVPDAHGDQRRRSVMAMRNARTMRRIRTATSSTQTLRPRPASWMLPAIRSSSTRKVYSGVYGRASINFYAFNSNGSKGIACGLNNLQKISDGEPLGGKTRAEDDFADEDEDFLS